MAEITQFSEGGRGLDELGSLQDPFVGRRRELGLLSRLLSGFDPRKRAAFVEGGLGIGKSRLLTEVLSWASGAGLKILRGSCYQVTTGGPYMPFVAILEQLRLYGPGSQPRHEARPDGLTEKASLRDLVEDLQERRDRFIRALSAAILQAGADSPTVLAIEDIHWADAECLLLLNTLLDIGAPNLAVICTARPDEPTRPDLRRLLALIEQKSQRVRLAGLALEEARELIDLLGGPGRITEEELQGLHSFTSGNPLFLRELFFHLQQTGVLERHSVPEAIKRSATPDRLVHLIDLRTRSLPAAMLRTVSMCAVAGTDFSLTTAAVVTGHPRRHVESHLQFATAKRVLRAVDDLSAVRYEFSHPVIRMRLYDSLSANHRRIGHRRLAEAAQEGQIGFNLEELAHHHAFGFGSEEGPKSIRLCRNAAERAEGLLAYEAAARFWELAIRCAESEPAVARADLYRRLGWSLWAAGKWTSAAEAWATAAELFESQQEGGRVGEIALALGELYRWRQELDLCERWLAKALESYRDPSPERGRTLALLGSLRSVQDSSSAALPLLEDAEQMLGGDATPAAAYWLSLGFFTSGALAKGLAVAKEGLEEARRRGSTRAMTLFASTLFHHDLAQLRVDEARRYARIVKEAAATDSSDSPGLIYSFICDALLAAFSGRWMKVLQLCERWMAKVRLLGPYQVATARVIWAEAELALGNPSGARRNLEKALHHLERMRPLASLHLARALLRLDEYKEASAIIDTLPEDVLASARFVAGRAMFGEVVAGLNRPDLWEQAYQSLRGEKSPLLAVYSPIATQRVMGRLASRMRDWPNASHHFEMATKQLEDHKGMWELKETYLDYASMREARARKGDQLKAAALRLKAKAVLNELEICPPIVESTVPFPWDNRFALTGRELEVLNLVARGQRNPEIAEDLKLSRRTVERHLENIFNKMGVNNRVEAVILAVEERLVGGSLSSQ